MLKSKAALLLAIPALAFSACGGDSDEDKIKQIIDDGTKDAASICDNSTDRFISDLGVSREECRKAAAEEEKTDKDDGVEDLKIEVDGDKATARFKDEDGDNTVEFVKEGDDWKVDSVSN
ncbi:MAG TPA: hypothetical protein VG318_08710 [Actinomycetota bacterium]|nr:hypothetical protein [Actinomycetota bacterium]